MTTPIGLAALCATLLLAPLAHGQPAFSYDRNIGIVVTRPAGSHCLSIPAAGLDGQRVLLADPSGHGAIITATISDERSQACPSDDPGALEHFYWLTVDGDVAPEQGSVWVAVLADPGALQLAKDGITGDLDGDAVQESLRVCTSSEGLHLTIWSGKGAPSAEKRRWHRYVSLGYDLDPTCTDKDY